MKLLSLLSPNGTPLPVKARLDAQGKVVPALNGHARLLAFNPDQPRTPAGVEEGGRWRSELLGEDYLTPEEKQKELDRIQRRLDYYKEVELLKGLPADVKAKFQELGRLQRDLPEIQMLKVQTAMGGGVLNPIVEHVGDLTHRMSHDVGWGDSGYEFVSEKLDKTIRGLDYPYGFEREFRENLISNARYSNVPLSELTANVDHALSQYADAHRQLPVYNDVQRLARDAAVAVGEKRFRDASSLLHQLDEKAKTRWQFAQEAAKFERNTDGGLKTYAWDESKHPRASAGSEHGGEWTSSARLDVVENRTESRIFLEGRLKPEYRKAFDTVGEVVAEATIDISPSEKTAHINIVNSWIKHRGLGKEILSHALNLLRQEGYRSATAYTERFNFEPQSMNKKLGAVETSRTDAGVNWKFDLTKKYAEWDESKHPRHAAGDDKGGEFQSSPSAKLIARWEETYRLWPKNADDRLSGFLASIAIGRDFGEDTAAYYERKGYTEFVKWARQKLGVEKRFAEALPLYVCRPVVNADQIIAWAKAQGFETALPAEDMHVTICFSKQPVDWSEFSEAGVWKTIRGRRVFIREGETPAEAILRSKRLAGPMYHGTFEDAVQSIQRHGIKPNGPMRAVFITADKSEAQRYAVLRANKKGTGAVLLTLRIPKKNWKEFEGMNSPEVAPNYFRNKKIPPEWIKKVEKLPSVDKDGYLIAYGDEEDVEAYLVAEFDPSGVVESAEFAFDPAKHPRHAAGSSEGGEFSPANAEEQYHAAIKSRDAAKEALWKVEAELQKEIEKARNDPNRKSDQRAPEVESLRSRVQAANADYLRAAAKVEPAQKAWMDAFYPKKKEFAQQTDTIEIVGGERKVISLGEDGAIVLRFESNLLRERWQYFKDHGASWDYDDYHPHVTVTYQPGNVILRAVQPYDGPIVLGPEEFKEIVPKWAGDIKEHVDWDETRHPRHPKGTEEGGKFASKETLSAFMKDLYKQTQSHPFDDRQRLLGMVGMEVSPWSGMIHLSSIISYEKKGEGQATKALQKLTEMADKYGVILHGTAKAIPEAGAKNKKSLTTEQLKKWYKKNGFEVKHDEIKYHPKSVKSFAETSIDYAQIKKSLDSLELRFARELGPELEKAKRELIAQLRAAGDNYADRASDLKLPNREALQASVAEGLRRAWDAGRGAARGEVQDAREFAEFDPAKHPRQPAGDEKGGEFSPKDVKPTFWDSFKKHGFTLLDRTDPRVYKTGSSQFPTFVRDGVRIAISSNQSLGVHRNDVYFYDGTASELILAALIVDPSARKQGHASRTMRDFVAAVDSSSPGKAAPGRGYSVFLEPVPIKKEGAAMSAAKLAAFYKKFGFEQQVTGSDRVLVRHPVKTLEQHDYAAPSFTPIGAIDWLRQKAFWVTDVLDDHLTADIRILLINALKRGTILGDILDDIEEAFAPYLLAGTQDELLPRHRLETVVRTNTTDAYNHGRLTEFIRPDMMLFLDGIRYSAILDSRTTEVCRFLHEKVFKPTDPALFELMPPRHYNCFIHSDVKVFTAKGWRCIGDIELGDLVLTKKGRFRPVTFLHHRQSPVSYSGEVVRVSFARHNRSGQKVIKPFSLSMTPDHPLLTTRGWIRAGELSEKDRVISLSKTCSQCNKSFPWLYVPGAGEGSECCSKSCQISADWGDKASRRKRGSRIAKTRYANGSYVWSEQQRTSQLASWTTERRERTAEVSRAQMIREYGSGKRDGKLVTEAAHSKIREMFAAGLPHPMHTVESKLSCLKARLSSKKWQAGIAKLRGGWPSKGQARLFSLAKSVWSSAEMEHVVACKGKNFSIDVALPEFKIGLEYDGSYWHTNRQLDAERDRLLMAKGWSVLRYEDRVPGRQELRSDVGRILRNHNKDYSFTSVQILTVERYKLKKAKRLYNLSVEGDESYVVYGLVSANCRSVLVPCVVGEKIDPADFITPAEVQEAKSLSGKGFEQKDFYDPDQPRVPAGAEDAGQWTAEGVGRYFADAPLDKAGATAWRKKVQKLYDMDKEFRAAIDATMLFTQGEYNHVRAIAVKEITGQLPDKYKKSSLAEWSNLKMGVNPLATYREYFKGQPFLNIDSDSSETWEKGARALNNAIRTAKPLSVPVYRGVYGSDNMKKLLSMQTGDTVDLVGPTSFTADKAIATKFSLGKASGQGGGGLNRWTKSAVVEVLPGARGIPVAAMSPWNQKEVISGGRFRIKEIVSDNHQAYHRGVWYTEETSRVVVEQVATFKNRGE